MTTDTQSAWKGFRTGLWQKEINVRDFIQQNYTPYDGDEQFLAPATPRTLAGLGHAQGAVRRGAQEGRARRVADPELDHRARARAISTTRTRSSSACRPRRRCKRAIMPNGGLRMVVNALKAFGYEPDPQRRRDVQQVPQDAQRGGVRRLHRGHPALPQLAHPDRSARRLRPRPHHRRLPPRRALRRRSADRAQAGGEGAPGRRALDGRHHPRSRGTVGTDPGAEGTEADGSELRLRHLGPGTYRPGKRCSGSTSATSPG